MNKSPFKRVHTNDYGSCAGWLVTVSVALLFTFTDSIALSQIALPQPNSTFLSQTQTLAPNEFRQGHINRGEIHTYQLTFAPQQFARIIVEQKGVDLSVEAWAPNGSLYRQIDNPNGLYGPETVSILSPGTATYTVKIHSPGTLPSGDYDIRVEGPRVAEAADEKRVTAEQLFSEAQTLRSDAANLRGPEADEKYVAAIKKYNEAAALWREVGELRGQGYALCNIGRAYTALRERTQALDYLAQALSVLRDADDKSGQAFVLNQTGFVHRDLGNLRDALTSYDAALKLRLTIGDRYGQAQLYNNIGLSYSNTGYQPQAAENLEKAIHLWRELGMREWEMNSLVTAAKAHAEMGDLSVALAQFQQVLNFCDAELRDEQSALKNTAIRLKPHAVNGIGLVYDHWADADTARVNYLQALELFRANKNLQGEADVLDNLGLLHAFFADTPQARDYFQEALRLREQLKQPRGWGMTLSNLGFVYLLLEQEEEALKSLNSALQLNKDAGDRRFEAYTLLWSGMAYVALEQPRRALEYYDKALAIQQEPSFADQRGQAITLNKIAEALKLLSEESQALTKYEQALKNWKAVGDGQGQALSLYGIAAIERDRLNLANARDRAEEAISIIEKLRTRVTGRQLQMTYFAAKQDVYALAIDVRMKLYELNKTRADLEAALSISEQARARNLLDLLSEAHVELNKGMSASAAEKNAFLQRQLDSLAQAFFRARSTGAQQSAKVIEQKLKTTIKEQDEFLLSVRKAGSRSANDITNARPLKATEIQQLLDENSVLLEYSLGTKYSHLWTVTRTEIRHHSLPGRAEIEKTAEQVRQALTGLQPQRANESDVKYLARLREAPERYRRTAVELGRMILSPALAELKNKQVIVVADGTLQYIPFEALHLAESAPREAGLTPLLLTNEVVYLPSASTLASLRKVRRPSATKSVAVIADPVFDETDQRVRFISRRLATNTSPTESKQKLARSLRDVGDTEDGTFGLAKLEYSLQEANAITSIAPRGSWMKAVGFKANRATVTSPLLKKFNIVHFATHGIVNDKVPELSGIVLSMINERGEQEDGFLTLRDIYTLDLPVNLVVLSACQTGVGQRVRGEGLIGLTRGFMYAGASSVVVSLWQVGDQATAELMKRFYKHMLGKNKLSPAAALRRAKLEMMEEKYEPFYWAGFILQGDWK